MFTLKYKVTLAEFTLIVKDRMKIPQRFMEIPGGSCGGLRCTVNLDHIKDAELTKGKSNSTARSCESRKICQGFFSPEF